MSESKKIYDDPNTKPTLYSLQPDSFYGKSRKQRREIAGQVKTTIARFLDEFPEDYNAVHKAVLCAGGQLPWPPTKPGRPLLDSAPPFIHILPCDSLQAAFIANARKDTFGKIGVVNPADPRSPEGWSKYHDTSVETTLNLRSLLGLTIRAEWYKPWRFDPEAIAWAPDVRVFALKPGCPRPDRDHFNVCFLSVSMPLVPELEIREVNGKATKAYKNESAFSIMQAKVRHVLQLACLREVNTLVLCPLGCEDKFGHPPEVIATLMRDALLGAGQDPPFADWRALGLHHVFIAVSNVDMNGQFEQSETLWKTFVNTFSNDPRVIIDYKDTQYLDAMLESSWS